MYFVIINENQILDFLFDTNLLINFYDKEMKQVFLRYFKHTVSHI